MSAIDPEPVSQDLHGERIAGGKVPLPSSAAVPEIGEPVGRLMIWSVVAGVLAGLLSWAGGELAWARVHSAQTPRIVAFPTGADRDRIIAGIARTTAVSFIQQGAILGAVLGLTGGLARRSGRAALFAAGVGALLAAIGAVAAGYTLLPVFFQNVDPQGNDLLLPLLTHSGIWAVVGAAAGLALGLGLGGPIQWARCALGGFLGGVAAAIVYDLIGALAFPLDKTSQPVSATVLTRFLAQLIVGVVVAAAAARAAAQVRRAQHAARTG
jgi:hypothetical protein